MSVDILIRNALAIIEYDKRFIYRGLSNQNKGVTYSKVRFTIGVAIKPLEPIFGGGGGHKIIMTSPT